MDSEQYDSVIKGLTRIESEQQSFRRELLGNGQPGRIQIMELDIKDVQGKASVLDKESGVLQWKLGTMSAIAGAILATAIQYAIRLLHLG